MIREKKFKVQSYWNYMLWHQLEVGTAINNYTLYLWRPWYLWIFSSILSFSWVFFGDYISNYSWCFLPSVPWYIFSDCGNHSLELVLQQVGFTVASVANALKFVKESPKRKELWTNVCGDNVIMLKATCLTRWCVRATTFKRAEKIERDSKLITGAFEWSIIMRNTKICNKRIAETIKGLFWFVRHYDSSGGIWSTWNSGAKITATRHNSRLLLEVDR